MNYKYSLKTILLPTVIAAAVVVGVVIGRYSSNDTNINSELLKEITQMGSADTKLGVLLKLIDARYVDNVELDSLTEDIIPKLLEKLDPHSVYIPAKDAVASNEHLEGEFEGIGVTFNMATDTVIIQSVISGGPSEKVGVISGDRIITVGDSTIAGRKVNQNDVVKMLKGKGGTVAKLGIERMGSKGLIYFDVIRGTIPIKSIDATFMIAPKVGYVKLLQFSRYSHKEFVEAVRALKGQGMEHLIFDMTGNTGGFLDQAISIANEFLQKDKLIVYTEGIHSPKMEQRSNGRGTLLDQDVLVLIDEGSASASEIVAGALQDNDVGTIVGRRSFGKGLVQQQMPFNDGSLLNLTIARYHTPTGRCIQRSYAGGVEQYNSDIMNRYLNKELISADSIKQVDSLKYTTPKGKIVYGGGGVSPDIFVPLDTTKFNGFIREVLGGNILFKYTLRYTDSNRKTLLELDSMTKLEDYFAGKDDMLYAGFLHYLCSDAPKISMKESSNEESKEFITTFIKAYVARNTPMQDNGFYLYFHNLDNIVGRAIELTQK